MKFNQLFNKNKPLIGMIHLAALPGYSSHPGMSIVIMRALNDLKTLEDAGFDGVLVENDNDQPHMLKVTEQITNAFTDVMNKVIAKAKIPVGMEIIYDMTATIEVAAKVKADFIRLDVFVDDVETQYGMIYGQSVELTKLKNKLNKDLVMLTDIHVKHTKIISTKSLENSAKEAISVGSDGIIITGSWTGTEPEMDDLIRIKKIDKFPVIVGSGFSNDNAEKLFSYADASIVGTSIKRNGKIDLKKAIELVATVKKLIDK